MNQPLFCFLLLLCVGCQQEYPSEYLLDEVDLVPEGIAYSKAEIICPCGNGC